MCFGQSVEPPYPRTVTPPFLALVSVSAALVLSPALRLLAAAHCRSEHETNVERGVWQLSQACSALQYDTDTYRTLLESRVA